MMSLVTSVFQHIEMSALLLAMFGCIQPLVTAQVCSGKGLFAHTGLVSSPTYVTTAPCELSVSSDVLDVAKETMIP